MIPKECKRLAEVDFPIAVVSKHSAREKSIRHGHPSTLHLWWARRPLAACRAMLLALLLPDPCDPHCPGDFKEEARDLLPGILGEVGPTDEDLRQALLKFIGDFSNWDASTDRTFLDVSRGLVTAANPEEKPLVVDPFAGGGSIPLEALRIGCETFASDLNPVACLILKVMLEDIPRYGAELAKELRRVGDEIKSQAEKELAEFYPKDLDGATPIAYLWARTVKCEAPNCGAEIPLARSFWLCKKGNRKRALKHKIVHPPGGPPHVEFEIFEPKADKDVHGGTVTRARATCLCCGTVLPPERVRRQLSEQRGGADVVFDKKGSRIGGAQSLAVVTLNPGETGRQYRLPTERDYEAVWKAQRRLNEILDEWERGGRKGICPVPDEPTPWQHGHRAIGSPRVYGMRHWVDLYTSRQALTQFLILRAITSLSSEDATVCHVAGMALSRRSDIANSLCPWSSSGAQAVHLFGRQSLPMLWDFAETSVFGGQAGDYEVTLHTMARVIETIPQSGHIGQVKIATATDSPLPDEAASLWFTDPPYYDAIPYADLSDFFYVWLRRVLPQHPLLVDPFDPSNPLTPKEMELTVTTVSAEHSAPKSRSFFEKGIAQSFAEGRRILRTDGIGSIVFAHKTTEGWEALLSGIIGGGLTVTGSWPISTERSFRLNARETASLATSIHLICRPRPEGAPIGDWGEVLRELPKRVGDWMEGLQGEGIRGADLVFACIGPALEIFSRYSKVETAEGREVKLAEFLEKVWEVVGRTALEQVLGTAEAKARNSTAGALEEDARLTALFLWTLQSTNGESPSPQPSPAQGRGGNKEDSPRGGGSEGDGEDEEEDDEEEETPQRKKQGYSLIFDVVRRFAQPLGIHLPEWEGRIIETKKGVVRLLGVAERAKQIFGEDGAQLAADRLERSPAGPMQLMLFPEGGKGAAPEVRGRGGKRKKRADGEISDEKLRAQREATTLDRVHAAMLLQASGRANALRALLKGEQDRGPDFLRLANALSALYPKDSEEKRLLDAMLLAMPRI